MAGTVIHRGFGYLAALAASLAGSGKAPTQPLIAAIEPTSLCNLSCHLCATGSGTLKRPAGSMTPEAFTACVDALPPSVGTLLLWGQGEPFMAPGFPAMARYAARSGRRVIVSTNGHFLDDTAAILDSGIHTLIVSLDGHTPAMYASYRAGGDFGRVTAGIRELAEHKRAERRTAPRIEAQCLVTRDNEHDLAAFRQLCDELGVDALTFKTLQAISMRDGESALPRDLSKSRYRRGRDGRLETRKMPLFGNRCVRIYYSFQVDWQGNVVPCCFDKDSDFSMGNIFETPFGDIWNNERYRRFRKRFAAGGNPPPMCTDCTEGLLRRTIHA